MMLMMMLVKQRMKVRDMEDDIGSYDENVDDDGESAKC